MDVLELLTVGHTPAVILDPREDRPVPTLTSLHLGGGTTSDRHHRLELLFRLPDLVDIDRTEEWLDRRECRALITQIVDGFDDEWDGRNRVGTYTAEAEASIHHLQQALSAMPTVDILKNLPAEFEACVRVAIPHAELDSYCDGLFSDEEYERIIDEYASQVEEHLSAAFPDYDIECAPRRGMLPASYDISVSASRGGHLVAALIEEQVQECLHQADPCTWAERATADAGRDRPPR